MRNGFKIFDADTHVRPDADLLEPYLDSGARSETRAVRTVQDKKQRRCGDLS